MYGEFPGDPVAKTELPKQGAQIPFIVRELDSIGRTKDSACCKEGTAQWNN